MAEWKDRRKKGRRPWSAQGARVARRRIFYRRRRAVPISLYTSLYRKVLLSLLRTPIGWQYSAAQNFSRGTHTHRIPLALSHPPTPCSKLPQIANNWHSSGRLHGDCVDLPLSLSLSSCPNKEVRGWPSCKQAGQQRIFDWFGARPPRRRSCHFPFLGQRPGAVSSTLRGWPCRHPQTEASAAAGQALRDTRPGCR